MGLIYLVCAALIVVGTLFSYESYVTMKHGPLYFFHLRTSQGLEFDIERARFQSDDAAKRYICLAYFPCKVTEFYPGSRDVYIERVPITPALKLIQENDY